MNLPTKLLATLAALFALAVPHGGAAAEGPYRNPDNKNARDAGEGSYPVPYKKPVPAEIAASLHRIRAYMEAQTPTRVVTKAGLPVTDFTTPVKDATVEEGAADFGLQVYEMGVVHAGMLKAAEATGDKRFLDMTARHLNFIAEKLPYFRAQEARFHLERDNAFSRFLDPRSLTTPARCARR